MNKFAIPKNVPEIETKKKNTFELAKVLVAAKLIMRRNYFFSLYKTFDRMNFNGKHRNCNLSLS
jgi:hypothetical protein